MLEEAALSITGQAQGIVLGPTIDVLWSSIGIIVARGDLTVNRLYSISQPAPVSDAGIICVRPM